MAQFPLGQSQRIPPDHLRDFSLHIVKAQYLEEPAQSLVSRILETTLLKCLDIKIHQGPYTCSVCTRYFPVESSLINILAGHVGWKLSRHRSPTSHRLWKGLTSIPRRLPASN